RCFFLLIAPPPIFTLFPYTTLFRSGIGRTGHIGFNEPGSHINSGTRIITLDHITRRDAASDFNGIEYVPKKAITMGVSTIMKSKRIIMLAWGHKKASIIKETVEGQVTSNIDRKSVV